MVWGSCALALAPVEHHTGGAKGVVLPKSEPEVMIVSRHETGDRHEVLCKSRAPA